MINNKITTESFRELFEYAIEQLVTNEIDIVSLETKNGNLVLNSDGTWKIDEVRPGILGHYSNKIMS